MKKYVHMCLFVLLVVLSTNAQADLTPESVAVVVNGDSWASLTIANEYVRLRDIPDSNVIVLNNISSFERMNIDTFRKEILQPVFETIEKRGLKGQIDCITYSIDLPTSVNVASDAKASGQTLPQMLTPVASTNGLTYLHEWVMRKDTDYLRLNINKYSRRVLPLPVGDPLSLVEAGEYRRGMALYAAKKFEEAAQVIEGLTAIDRNNPALYYNLACCQALIGRNDAAMESLTQAVSLGWRDHKHLSNDTDLISLRERADFKTLLKNMQSKGIELQPTRGFHSTQAWNEQGEPSETGSRYMLSTMLGVTSGRGNSIQEVIDCLRRAETADYSAPKGTVYFLRNGNVRSTTREWAFTDAGKQLQALGVRSLTEDGILPKNKPDVAGAVIGTASFNWNTSKSTILPGAIVEHLTSFGGMMRERDGQTPCTDFIRAGAAGSSGTVTEPLAIQAKFPNAFMHMHYAKGSTLAEAFYQSLEGPYQLLIIGDPLCKPWGKEHRVTISGITRNISVKGEVKIKPQIFGRDNKIASYLLFVDGKYVQSTVPGEFFKLDTTAFPDGEHTIAIVAQHDNALETRDRSVIPVRIRNTNRSVRLSSPKTMKAEFGNKVAVKLMAAGASSLELTHLGRVVGTIEKDRGVIELDTSRIGLGVSTLRVIARFNDNTPHVAVRGPSITVNVTPPTIKNRTNNSAKSAETGMLISIENGPATPLLDTYKPNWLTDAGVTDGKSFELTGIFEGNDLGALQIQLKTNTGARIEIDGRLLAEAINNVWQYTPVQLTTGTPGTHLLYVTGTAPEGKTQARLDLRMGTTGTCNPSDRWLRQGTEK